jgi:sporulation protein YlmC with PRC-barrel domain
MRKALATTSLWIALVALPGVALAASDSDKTAVQTHTFQATKMIGTNIKDMSGNTIGEVDDVLVTTTGGVRGVVSDVGGFLGVGERHVLLDWNAIVVSRDGDDLKITSKFTKATLENLKPYEWTAKKKM